MKNDGSFKGKFSALTLFLYFVILRIFWNVIQIINTEYHERTKPLITKLKSNETIIPRKFELDMKNERILNTPSKNLTQKKKAQHKGRRINLRKKNFGHFDSWESGDDKVKVLLWTGYGPLQEGMQLWGRVLSDIVEARCPESRCTFSTNKSLATQEQAHAVLFHMPNFHWDK